MNAQPELKAIGLKRQGNDKRKEGSEPSPEALLQHENPRREKNAAKETEEQWEADIHSSWGDRG